MVVERVSTMIGYDIRDRKWVSFCPKYDLDVNDVSIDSSWNQMVDLCNKWLEWSLLYGYSEINDENNQSYLNMLDSCSKHPYDTVEIGGLGIEMTGWIVLDTEPKDWQQGQIRNV